MDPVDLGGSLGEGVKLTPPRSFAVVNDLVTAWSGNPSRVHLSRLCAASLAVCMDGAPVYPVEEGNPIAYGAKALDWLMRKGVTPTRIYEVGPRVLHALTLTLPKEIEVEKIEDFTEATGEVLTA